MQRGKSCKKDARIELRTREIIATAGVFAVVVGILASIAYHTMPKLNRATAAGHDLDRGVLRRRPLLQPHLAARARRVGADGPPRLADPANSIFLGKARDLRDHPRHRHTLVAMTCSFFFAIDFTAPDDVVRDPSAPQDPQSTHMLAFLGIMALASPPSRLSARSSAR